MCKKPELNWIEKPNIGTGLSRLTPYLMWKLKITIEMLEKSNLPVWVFAIKVMKYQFYDPCKIILPLSWFHKALKTSLSVKIEHISCSKLCLFAVFTLLCSEIILKGQILNHNALITVWVGNFFHFIVWKSHHLM